MSVRDDVTHRGLSTVVIHFSVPSELMVTMGFPNDEISESLKGQKFDEVMATYLLLGRKAPEVSSFCLASSRHRHHQSCDPHPSHFVSMLQFEGSEPITNSVLGQRQRPTSDINNSSSISPAHPKVTRSISANQKQRRFSDHGGDDDGGGGGGGGDVEKPSKVTSPFPALRVLLAAFCVGGSCSQSL